ncbi:type I secretion system permease/ATPase [Ancylobacter rudongensis]|uniref:ATP-binding cassette, subfamily C n=1 Tax=Ancylobacter rudongensis TaxID=177413 RepID=A0A1G4QM22_9HYPH|nr:type I secretion system permease/ATPase [Ancylobacter rudongensis]SCW45670.1 ATP-binding cassette, subfamily C [Ancylobacter rudongensis]
MTARRAPGSVAGTALDGSRKALLGVGLFSGVTNLLMLTGPLFMLQVYDRVLVSRSLPTLWVLGLIATALYIAFGMIDYARSRVLARLGDQLEAKFSARAFRREIADAFDGQATEGRPTADLATIRRFLGGPAPLALFDLPWVPLYLVVLGLLHWSLGLMGVLGVAVVVSLAVLNDRLTRLPMARAAGEGAQASALLEASRRASEAVTALGMRPHVAGLWVGSLARARATERTGGDAAARIAAVSRGFRLFLQSATLAVGAVLVIEQAATGGIMIASSIMLGRALAPIDQIVAQWKAMAGARIALARLEGRLALDAGAGPKMDLPTPTGRLSLANIIAAPPGLRRPVLEGIGFQVEPGEGLGILGPSASGKSTLARLIVGLWRPLSGSVRLDGATLDQWDADTLGRHIGYLPQDVELIGGTVREAISRHQPGARDEDIVRAAQAAAAHPMILKLPDGYMTRLGPGGAALSGGQRQRIALARALYGAPCLIVLDEPNASLDQEGDAALTAALLAARKRGAAVIVITHRASGLAACDRALVLKDGRIAALGPKEAVLRDLMKPPVDAAARPALATERGA